MQKTGVGEVAPEPFHEEYIRGFFSENVKPVEEVIGKKNHGMNNNTLPQTDRTHPRVLKKCKYEFDIFWLLT